MNQITHWINQQKKRAFMGLMAGLLLMSSVVFPQNALAQASIVRATAIPALFPAPVTKNPEPFKTAGNRFNTVTKEVLAPADASIPSTLDAVVSEIVNPFQKILTKTQTAFDNALTQANEAIADLPQQIEKVSAETEASVRKQLKNQIGDKQDVLENVADKIDDLAESLESFNSKLQKSIQQAKVTVSDKFVKGAQDAQLSLENAAKAVNDLADDVERAKKNSTPAFRSLIGEEITSVNQTLEAATNAVKAFVTNPV